MEKIKCPKCPQVNLSPTKHGMKCWDCGNVVPYSKLIISDKAVLTPEMIQVG